VSSDNIAGLARIFGSSECQNGGDSGMIQEFGDSIHRPRDVRYLVALMTSNKKIDANRANAKKSTGPKTPGGKALSRFNAQKFGAFAAQPIIRGEDSDEHAELVAQLTSELSPQTAIENMLVDQIIGDMWRLKRLEKAERAYFEKMRQSLFSRLLSSMTQRELDLAIPLIEDEDALRDAQDAQNKKVNLSQIMSFDFMSPSLVDAIPKEMSAEQARMVKRSLLERIKNADDLGTLLLEGFAAPQKDIPYTHLDRLRRSLVRDILQKYEALALLQRDGRTIDGASRNAD
jgi:hypothetical protein